MRIGLVYSDIGDSITLEIPNPRVYFYRLDVSLAGLLNLHNICGPLPLQSHWERHTLFADYFQRPSDIISALSVNDYHLEMPPPIPYTPPQSCEPPLHPYPRIPRDYRRSSCSPQPSTSKGITHSYASAPRDSGNSSHSPQPSTSEGFADLGPRILSDSQGSSDTEPASPTVPCSVVLKRILSNPNVRRQLLGDTLSAPPRSPSPLSQSSDSSSQDSSTEEGDQRAKKRRKRRQIYKKKSIEHRFEVDQDEEEEDDEALRDPDHFIKIFTAVNGPVSKFSPKFVQTLEKYLDKVNRSPNDPKFMTTKSKYSGASAGNVDFVEAAFVVQGSSEIYGKKVDLLFNAAVSLLRVLSTPFEDLEGEEEDEDGETRTPNQKARKGTKRPRLALENRDLAEEILEVDNFKEGKKIDQKKTVQGRFEDVIKDVIKRPIVNVRLLPPIIPRLVRKTKALANNPEDAQKFNSKRVPQFGQGLEGRGFVDEYRLNEVMRMADSMLVDHIIPIDKDQASEEIDLAVGKASESVAAAAEETMTIPQEADIGVGEAATSPQEADVAVEEAMASSQEVDASAEEVAVASDGVSVPSEETRTSSVVTVVSSESVGTHESTGSSEETGVPVDDGALTTNKLSQTPVNTCDSGIDSCPSSVYNPVENIGVHDLSWEGNSSAVCVESDAISVLDDGCVSVDGGVSEVEEDGEPRAAAGDKNAADSVESGVEVSENERSCPESSETPCEALQTDQESHLTDVERDNGANMDVSDTTDVLSPSEDRTPSKSHPGLQEMNFTPTPKRNKRKMKNFKLPCKLSLLLPDKKKKRGSKAAELWRPSQSPCSSSSSTYPQSPMSYSAPSPDHHSLNLMLNDDDNFVPPEPLSESDNEGEFIDPGDQSQVNYWIRNHEKDLMSAGQVCTLSDRVAQWQELIQPRLEANLIHGPYSHIKYAPILMELVSQKGWPCPQSSQHKNTEKEEEELRSLEEEYIYPLDWRKEPPVIKDKAPLDESRITFCIPYDFDFVERRECDGAWGGDSFQGFPTVKKMKRRGVVLTVDSRAHDPVNSLFAALCRIYEWGFSETERQLLRHEEEEEKWRREKNTWLKSKVGRGRPVRRNWDEWAEEDDNIEVNMDMELPSTSIEGASSSQSEPVPFKNIISGLRKEEVSRLLFTALHLASQGHMDIISTPGEINSMEVVLRSNTES